MTLQEATRYSTDQLKTIYDESEAAIISDWVMEYLTGIKKSSRIPHLKQPVPTEQITRLQTYLDRLLKHEPVQYVLNEAWFCGLKFYIDKHVLIPRPETEELVEWIITNCRFPVDQLRILDIGTGSGCIPIALKRRLGKAEVWSCDISKDALAVANRNAETLGVNVKFLELDFLNEEQRNSLPSFDIIVSNPPYIPIKDKAQMQPNVVNFEPATALFVPDNDPLVFYSAIADFAKDHLNVNGSVYTEIHEDLGQDVVDVFESKGFNAVIKKDMQGKDRMIKATPN